MSLLNWLMNIKPIFFPKIQKSIFNIKLQLKLAVGLESLKRTKYRFFMFVLALIPPLVKSQELSPTTVWRCVGSYNRIKHN